MARSMKAKAPSEHEEQTKVVGWLDNVACYEWRNVAIMNGKLPFYAVPNAAKRSYKLASYLKAEGLRPGVSDLVVAVPNGKHHGLYVEMKPIKEGAVSVEQEMWLNGLTRLGYRAVVCRGADAAIKEITNYLNETRKV